MPEPLDPLVKSQRENVRLRLDNANLRALNKKLLRRGGGYDDFLDALKDVLHSEAGFKSYTAQKLKPVAPADPKHEEIACVAVSDIHLSETVKLEDSNGINLYNSMIAANRMWKHVQTVKKILTLHMNMYKFRSIWSPLLGDVLNGTIHQEMIATNDLSDPAAVVLGARLLHMFYMELKAVGVPIEIDAIHGNHPRTTVKVPTKSQAVTNMDWMVYQFLADKFEKDDQVKITIHTSQIGMKRLYGWNYVFEHGIDVKNGREEEFEDRIRALFDDPTFRAATGYSGSSFDQIVIGNLHKPKYLERTCINGSYTAQNELGMSWRLKPIRAQQLLWGVTRKYVRTFQYAVDMTDIRSEKVENPFSEYTKWYLDRFRN